jgi:FG-GAP repeat
VAVSGDTVVVGASEEASNAAGVNGNQDDNSANFSGAVYVFKRTNGGWAHQAYLKASNSEVGDSFGYAVAVSGELVAVGAWREESSATGVNGNQADNVASASGAAYVFTLSGPLRFVPVPLCRLLDTRESDLSSFGSPRLLANVPRSFVIPQQPACGIPATAQAYSLNVTVVPGIPINPANAVGFVRIWATGSTEPATSTVNSEDGRFKANAAIVEAGAGGAVSVRSTNATDVVIDINGYFVDPAVNPQSLAFYPLPPCRVFDSRNSNGPLGGPVLIPTDDRRTIPVTSSNCGVPANAAAYSLNATAVPPAAGLGFLTLWPTGQTQPFVSTLNAPTGAITANAAIVQAGSNGSINAFVSGVSHLVIDINGYFAPPGGAGAQRFFTIQPCRAVDTQTAAGEFGGPSLVDDVARSYRLPLNTACGLPANATAYALSATVDPTRPVAQGGLGYLTLFPTGSPQPFVSTLNALDGFIASNAAIVPAGTGGAVSAFASGGTHLILDVVGFFLP